ncbi:hypothetical protein CPLU01_01342 [Colletotrichum plurivorum]|uniref:Pfs domain-containing protein n=1 Tax=Colletotrichum plurivorum TaxID=2175906 RepID=A0A8H6NPV7_9PEZI|nr:hypothetical protein CPLU01_01342 [Colletotrichum plurivorum]
MRRPLGFEGWFDKAALQEASARGHLEVVKLLLEHGASVNHRNPDDPKDTPAIDHASAGGHVDVVHLLLQHGADLELREASYQTLLESVARRGNAEEFQVLLQKGSNIETKTGAYGTAMAAASAVGHFGIVKMLLAQATEENKTLRKIYPKILQRASQDGHEVILRLLLDHGGNTGIVIPSSERSSALCAASTRGHVGVVNLLLHKDPNPNGAKVSDEHVIEAAGSETMDIFQLILEARCSLEDAPASCLEKAFGKASTSYHRDMMSLLLDKGVDVNTKLDDHDTAILIASKKGRRDIAGMLLERGADVNWVHCEEDETALQAAAARGGHGDLVEFLLEEGADVNFQGGCWGSAIIAAASGGHLEIVQLLLNKGAVINTHNLGWQTALQAAFRNRHADTVEVLLEAGVDLLAEIMFAVEAVQREGLGQLREGNDFHEHTTAVSFARWLLVDHIENSPHALECAPQAPPSTWLKLIEISKLSLSMLEKKIKRENGVGVTYATPLMLAVLEGSSDVVELIRRHDATARKARLEIGHNLRQAALDLMDLADDEKLQKARNSGFEASLRFVIENETTFGRSKGPAQRSGLLEGLVGDQAEIATILLHHWVDTSADDFEYKTYEWSRVSCEENGDTRHWGRKGALQIASHAGFLDAVQILHQQGVDVDEYFDGKEGDIFGPPLYEAVLQGHVGIALLLIDHGARADLRYKSYENVFAAALDSGNEEMIWLLTEKGLAA